jgi:hypothetical protein
MKLKQFLQEVYVGRTVVSKGVSFEIFKNPDSKELRSCNDNTGSGLRFIIDINKKFIYIWNGNFIHQEAIYNYLIKNNIIDNPYYEKSEDYLIGYGDITNNKIYPYQLYLSIGKFKPVETIDDIRNRNMIRLSTIDISWTDRYFGYPLGKYIKNQLGNQSNISKMRNAK